MTDTPVVVADGSIGECSFWRTTRSHHSAEFLAWALALYQREVDKLDEHTSQWHPATKRLLRFELYVLTQVGQEMRQSR